MALTRLNNRSVSGVTALPSGVTLPDDTIMPSGSILQVVFSPTTGVPATSSTSWATLLSLSITPLYSNSKILIMANPNSLYVGGGAVTNQFSSWRISRDGSQISGTNTNFHAEIGRNMTYGTRQLPEMKWIDNANTTSQIVYTVQAMITLNGGSLVLNDTAGTSTVIAMEIAG